MTIAVDEVPIIPAITKISRVPQSSAQSEHEPGAEVEGDVLAARPQETPPAAQELVDRELDPEVEQQQDETEHRQQVDLVGILEHDDAGRVRAEDDPRDDEERDRRQAEAPADAGEQPGEEESRSENGELAVHRLEPAVRRRPRRCAVTPNYGGHVDERRASRAARRVTLTAVADTGMAAKVSEVVRRPSRLRALAGLEANAESSAEALDRIARTACRVLSVPVVLVNLVGADRQRFVGCEGPEPWPSMREMPITAGFCPFALGAAESYSFADARVDPALAANAAVEQLGVTAYAGVPLRAADGEPIGTLCAIDYEPHAWSDDELALLADSPPA